MENTIEHHGILGQKWGVRRYQNKDGSLTTAGKQRVKQQIEPTEDKDTMLSIARICPTGFSIVELYRAGGMVSVLLLVWY